MRPHRFDPVSFFPGLLFVAIAAVALGGGLTLDLFSHELVWPVVLIGLGLLVLVTAGLGRRRPEDDLRPASDEAAGTPVSEPLDDDADDALAG